ncbi:PP2C family protein-serine/threonine phosphatase [Streptomyces sp. NPDC058232]|uniref:PP2C family protein-serine/threonine phosphatase n=1 Tax=Streptomyces sp. NPDC058232 TaxID=3346393 RepID=UPI0036EBA922
MFDALPSPCLVFRPDFLIVGANRAYCHVTQHLREDLVGRFFFKVFPGDPTQPGFEGVRNLSASMERVLTTREPDRMALLRYDVLVGPAGVYEERWWAPVNSPVLGRDGQVRWVLHRAEDVTPLIRAMRDRYDRPAGPTDEQADNKAELFQQALELQHLNEKLNQANARERRVAITLQEAMLHSPDLAGHENIAVRYLPAISSLNVCGDWYDVADLPHDRFAVAVGDVVGHGLEAATVMGKLNSALSAASRGASGPARAMEVLDLYARPLGEAMAATAVSALINTRSQLIAYSSAGHPPPVLLHTNGHCTLLDQATDPPVGFGAEHVPRPQVSIAYHRGDTLVLYTDGLIERRGEDIDTGLRRLTDSLTQRCNGFGPEHVADTLLIDLGVSHGGPDDVALVVVTL